MIEKQAAVSSVAVVALDLHKKSSRAVVTSGGLADFPLDMIGHR
jgi:hypothetical protein